MLAIAYAVGNWFFSHGRIMDNFPLQSNAATREPSRWLWGLGSRQKRAYHGLSNAAPTAPASSLPQSPQTAPAPLPVPRLSPEREHQDLEDSRCLQAIRPEARKCRDLVTTHTAMILKKFRRNRMLRSNAKKPIQSAYGVIVIYPYR